MEQRSNGKDQERLTTWRPEQYDELKERRIRLLLQNQHGETTLTRQLTPRPPGVLPQVELSRHGCSPWKGQLVC